MDAARDLGLDKFTMGEVAAKIGVAAPAVYRIFAGRGDLLASTVKSAADQTAIIPPNTEPREAVQFFTDGMWQTMEHFHGLARVLKTNPDLFAAFAPHLEALADALDRAGISEDNGALAASIYLDSILQLSITMDWVKSAEPTDLPDAERFPRLHEHLTNLRNASPSELEAHWQTIFTTVASDFGAEEASRA